MFQGVENRLVYVSTFDLENNEKEKGSKGGGSYLFADNETTPRQFIFHLNNNFVDPFKAQSYDV